MLRWATPRAAPVPLGTRASPSDRASSSVIGGGNIFSGLVPEGPSLTMASTSSGQEEASRAGQPTDGRTEGVFTAAHRRVPCSTTIAARRGRCSQLSFFLFSPPPASSVVRRSQDRLFRSISPGTGLLSLRAAFGHPKMTPMLIPQRASLLFLTAKTRSFVRQSHPSDIPPPGAPVADGRAAGACWRRRWMAAGVTRQ